MPHPWIHSRPAGCGNQGNLVWWLVALHIAGGLKLNDRCGPFQPRPLYESVEQPFPGSVSMHTRSIFGAQHSCAQHSPLPPPSSSALQHTELQAQPGHSYAVLRSPGPEVGSRNPFSCRGNASPASQRGAGEVRLCASPRAG